MLYCSVTHSFAELCVHHKVVDMLLSLGQLQLSGHHCNHQCSATGSLLHRNVVNKHKNTLHTSQCCECFVFFWVTKKGTHHYPCKQTHAFPTVRVWYHVPVANREEGNRDEPHGSQEVTGHFLFVMIPEVMKISRGGIHTVSQHCKQLLEREHAGEWHGAVWTKQRWWVEEVDVVKIEEGGGGGKKSWCKVLHRFGKASLAKRL